MDVFSVNYEDFYFKTYSAAEKRDVTCTQNLHIYIESIVKLNILKIFCSNLVVKLVVNQQMNFNGLKY